MLNYEWGDSSPTLLSVDDSTPTQDSVQTRQIFNHYNQSIQENFLSSPSSFSFQQQQNQTQLQTLHDSQAFSLSYSHPLSPDTMVGATNGGCFLPKTETCECGSMSLDFPARIGLNLGGRTYFSSTDEDRLYRQSRTIETGPSNSPKCQAEGCNADLTEAKHYHRRHKVCEFHSKASTVLAGGMNQRFCQQCSRFHLLAEFDQGKRSCRKRLADHNRRRRKSQSQQPQTQPQQSTQSSSSQTLTRSSPESVVHSSVVTVAVSPASLFSQVGNFRAYDRGQSLSWAEDEEACGRKRGSEFKM
ncbi:hypothetical protein NE237_028494 [Protea cynaroides]|uniref:SBP-type domain-containing protein n=1 Tax=Protea cynaroides TaxID=273540 RepID=A0A9Q0JU50_9MAGN|nr:hypothetical protein NE237_028494 [Protea cynaroides]